jgi:hypothetical protein
MIFGGLDRRVLWSAVRRRAGLDRGTSTGLPSASAARCPLLHAEIATV